MHTDSRLHQSIGPGSVVIKHIDKQGLPYFVQSRTLSPNCKADTGRS